MRRVVIRMRDAVSVMAVVALVTGCALIGPYRGPLTSVNLTSKDVGDGFYIEGYLPTTRAWGPDGSLILDVDRSLKLGGPFQWPAGRYRFESWVEACDGSCQELDAPSDRCEATIEVAGVSTSIVILRRVGSPCTIEVRP